MCFGWRPGRKAHIVAANTLYPPSYIADMKFRNDMPVNLNDSRAALAAEIADSVRLQLRAKQDAAELERAIEKTLLDEARRAELRLAYLRVGAAGLFSLFVFARLLLAQVTHVSAPTVGSLGAA